MPSLRHDQAFLAARPFIDSAIYMINVCVYIHSFDLSNYLPIDLSGQILYTDSSIVEYFCVGQADQLIPCINLINLQIHMFPLEGGSLRTRSWDAIPGYILPTYPAVPTHVETALLSLLRGQKDLRSSARWAGTCH